MCEFNSAEYKYLSSIQQNIIDISPRKFIGILLTINESQCVAFTLSHCLLVLNYFNKSVWVNEQNKTVKDFYWHGSYFYNLFSKYGSKYKVPTLKL